MVPDPAPPPPLPAPRTPTRRQLFYARNGPFRILHLLAQAASVSVCLGLSGLLVDGVWDREALLRLLWVLFLAVVLAMCVTIVLSAFFLAPIYQRQAAENGAPFAVGDTVQVLAGPHAGAVGKIYATWQGETLRVDLGEDAKARYRDIFAPAQLLRADGGPT